MAEKERPAVGRKAKGGTKRPRRPASGSAKGTGGEGRAESFYAELFTPAEIVDLARAEGEPSLEDEIALLRVAIRRGMAENESLETISRSIQRLAQMIKVQRTLQGQGIRNLEEALARVLDELGGELGDQGFGSREPRSR